MEDAMESVAGIGTQDPGDISSTREWLGVVLDPWIDTFYDLRRRPVTCGDGDACLEPRATLSDIPEYNKAMQLFGGDVLEHAPLPLPPSFPAASWPVLCEALTNPGAPTVVTGLTQSNGGLRLIGIMVFEWVLVCMVSRWCSKVREVIERSCPWEDLAVGMGIQSLVVHTPVNGSSVTKKQLQSAGRSVLAAVCLTHGLVEAVDWAIRLVRDKTQAAHDAMPADLQREMLAIRGLPHVMHPRVAANIIVARLTDIHLSRILYLLGLHPDAQIKLREELIEAGAPDNLDYDLLDRLPYLEAVCRETLRLHAPVRFLQRVARQDHVLPLQEPILDVNGKILSEVFVPKGTAIYCNIIAVNTDPAIWGPDAKEWKPERWLNPLPESVTSAHIPGIYTNTLTFAGGSRSCIGFKFSQLEMKVMLSQFLPAFRFEPSEKHEIIWRFGGIVTPATKAGSQGAKSELPLRISCL
ncbi:cytochrome P450 [Peniophora sp. CONT]|nr:cytochrome P450 [Peniophora sp. CONT]